MITKITYGYKDVGIVPAEISYVKSRSECNPYYGFFGGKQNILPLFASPMSSVISDNNYETFEEHGITSIIPRNIPFEKRKELLFKGAWTGFSLNEFEELFCNEETYEQLPIMEYRVCIDIANGEMACLYDICKKAKKMSLGRAYVLTIMTGNIGNPATYNWIRRLNNGFCEKYKVDELVIDYIRVDIGNGNGCLTSSRTGVHYGIASLIDECNKIKFKYEGRCCPKIIADGGVRDFSDAIKALALGADYVMIGSVFARFLESAGEKILENLDFVLPSQDINDYTDFDYDDVLDQWVATYKDGTKYTMDIDVTFFGMASGNGQRCISGEKTKVSEGTTKRLKVNFTMSKWINIMVGCLKSAMSYCNSFTLEDFVGKQELVILSQNEINSLNK